MGWIHLRHHGHDQNYNYVQAYNAGGDYLYRNAGAPLEWETFALWAPSPPRGGNAVALQSMHPNTTWFVSAYNNGGSYLNVRGPAIDAWETFTIRFVDGFNGRSSSSNDVIVSGDVISLRTGSGHYFTAPTADGIVRADATSVGVNERFTIYSSTTFSARLAYTYWRDSVQATV